jgi:hypothetical protein
MITGGFELFAGANAAEARHASAASARTAAILDPRVLMRQA